MSAPVVVIPPDPLQLAAEVLRRTGDDIAARARRLQRATTSTALNGADPGFSPGVFRRRLSTIRARLSAAATETVVDVHCASRTVEQAIAADAVLAVSAAGGTVIASTLVSRLDVDRGSPIVGPDIPLNPICYLGELGRLANELDERLQVSAGGCVGVCLNVAFQDGVLTTSVGAGLAYSIGADMTLKPIMSEEERTMDWEEHRIFFSAFWAGGEVTKRVNPDGTTEQWTPRASAGLSPLKAGGGWVYQWNRRDEVWDR
ncbi:MAG: hypothetical protein OES24_07935 [Acidimicrobiia bacterium]|nr:hypothetical protein [Acidimicrobiia bacterium]